MNNTTALWGKMAVADIHYFFTMKKVMLQLLQDEIACQFIKEYTYI